MTYPLKRPNAAVMRGAAHHAARLDADKVRAIRHAWSIDKTSMHEIAARYGVTPVAIWKVVHRKSWASVM